MKKIVILSFFIFLLIIGCDLFITLPDKKDNTPHKPTIKPPAGRYDNTVDITISASSSDDYIYFTIDGANPTNTNYYSGGKGVVFYRAKNVTIKAVTYRGGYTSEVSEVSYE